MNRHQTNILYLIFLAVIFLLVSFFVQENYEMLEIMIQEYSSGVGMLVYVFLAFITTVVAPLTSVPLIPLASALWGWQVAGILNLVGWGLGSYIAFKIAQRYGRPVVKRFVSLEKIEKYENRMPKEHIFWTIVFLRIIIPVDLLSYALGIFTKVNINVYIAATLVGMAPGSFILSYVGTVPFKNQMVFFGIFFVIIWIIIYFKYLKKMK